MDKLTEINYISPLFYIGIFLFVLPTILNLFHIVATNLLFKIGIGCIILGAIHTIYKRR